MQRMLMWRSTPGLPTRPTARPMRAVGRRPRYSYLQVLTPAESTLASRLIQLLLLSSSQQENITTVNVAQASESTEPGSAESAFRAATGGATPTRSYWSFKMPDSAMEQEMSVPRALEVVHLESTSLIWTYWVSRPASISSCNLRPRACSLLPLLDSRFG